MDQLPVSLQFVLVEVFQVVAFGMSFKDMNMHPFSDFVQITGENLVMEKELISKKSRILMLREDFWEMTSFGFSCY